MFDAKPVEYVQSDGKPRVDLNLNGLKACQIIEGHVMPDHMHRCIEVLPTHAVASIIGFIKGKSAIAIARQCGGRDRHFSGEHFWARGYAVSTVGFALEHVRASIRDQDASDDDGLFEAVR